MVDQRKQSLNPSAIRDRYDMTKKLSLLFIFIFSPIIFVSCLGELSGTVITKPDEYVRTYEAKEKIVLRAVASVFKEKHSGANVTIDEKNMLVNSDFIESGGWRTKAIARVKRLNWKESEVNLSVITEKKTEKGWEMRRLLEKEQYDTFFNIIDLRIYEEMSKID